MERLQKTCDGLVIDQRVIKPEDLCHAIEKAESFDSCQSDFWKGYAAQDIDAACALMVHDPDLAPACKGIQPPNVSNAPSE